ncbi:MAG TPA: SRPBCC domain-containing protein [Candidatus Dormibacteraeota bacterium]
MTGSSRITLERTFDAEIADLWELWTTKAGFESWWGPEGFRTEVRKLDVEVGGETVYAMTAVGADQIEFLRKAGMPLESQDTLTLTEVVPGRRLAYTHVIGFVPGVAPYRVGLEVEFAESRDGARMVLTMDAMHDDRMTRLAVMGMQSQLDRLAARFARPRGGSGPLP